DQLTDARRGKAQVIEVQRQERRGGAEQGEVEQIEAGQSPVGNRRHGSAATARAGWSAMGCAAASGAYRQRSTGVVTLTSAFCARWRKRWSISTMAIIASAIGVA